MFHGTMVAIVTPFKDGEIDEESLRALVEFQIENGTSAIVPCGTTGESATLTHNEHQRVIEICIDAVNKRVPVIAGTGSNCTNEAIEITKHAFEAGADGALMLAPYYNKPTQEGLYLHYKAVAESVNIPIVLYNVPGRTSVNILPETVARLSKISNIVAIKEACGDVSQIMKIKNLCGDDIDILSGDDALFYPLLCIGAKGVISVTANILPGKVADVYRAFSQGDIYSAKEKSNELFNLHNAMFIETNPIPVKTALALMGKVEKEFRLPLSAMADTNEEKLKVVLRDYGLIQ